jgi:hypothetical protein
MQDNLEKYLQLLGLILLSVAGFLIAFVLLLLGFRGLFGLFSYVPWIAVVYKFCLMCIPFMVFMAAYVIFFRRNRLHPAAWVRFTSALIFTIAIGSWIFALSKDMYNFSAKGTFTVEGYLSFNMFFLAGHVATIFLTGILQALTTAKEPDWMDR